MNAALAAAGLYAIASAPRSRTSPADAGAGPAPSAACDCGPRSTADRSCCAPRELGAQAPAAALEIAGELAHESVTIAPATAVGVTEARPVRVYGAGESAADRAGEQLAAAATWARRTGNVALLDAYRSAAERRRPYVGGDLWEYEAWALNTAETAATYIAVVPAPVDRASAERHAREELAAEGVASPTPDQVEARVRQDAQDRIAAAAYESGAADYLVGVVRDGWLAKAASAPNVIGPGAVLTACHVGLAAASSPGGPGAVAVAAGPVGLAVCTALAILGYAVVSALVTDAWACLRATDAACFAALVDRWARAIGHAVMGAFGAVAGAVGAVGDAVGDAYDWAREHTPDVLGVPWVPGI